MNSKLFKIVIFIFIIIMLIIGCEPISVSVNSEGEVAFTRGEGVFYLNLKTQKLNILDWNYGKETIPAIVRWAPKSDKVALTIKDNKDSQATAVYIIDKKGNNKKIYSGTKVITQLEWSIDGNYISFAQAGQDTELNVADIGLISVKDGMSKIILQNCGDVHRWLNNNEIVFIKINKKNQNTDIFLGELSLYKIESQNIEVLSNIIVSSTGGLDCSPVTGQIAFTAITVMDDAKDFKENMSVETFLFAFNIKSKKIEKISDDVINFVKYSPDESKILVKVKDKNLYTSMNFGYFDSKNKSFKLLANNVTDKVNANSMEVQVYPCWYDNNVVLFLKLNNNYGSNTMLQLMSIDISNLKKKNYQPVIETEIFKLVEAKGGY